jgi:hypothetical protein
MGPHGLISRSARRVLGVLLLAVVLSLAASSTTRASDTSSQAAFRQQLMVYVTQMQHVATMFQSTSQGRAAYAELKFNPSTGFARARAAVRRMTPAQLSMFQATVSAYPQWRSIPTALQRLAERTGHTRRLKSVLITADDCPTAIAAGYTQTDVEIAADLSLVADAVLQAIPDDTLAVVARVIAVALWAVPQTAQRVIEHSYNIAQACQQNDLQSFIQQNLDVKVSTLATQSSLTSLTTNFNTLNSAFNAFNATFNSLNTLVNNNLDTTVSSRASQTSLTNFNNQFTTNATLVNTKLDTITTSVNNANTKLDNLTVTVNNNGALDLRLKIEEDLSQPGLHPIALFEIPASAGGYLGLARTIVVDTIAKTQSVGESVGTAPSFLTAADSSIAAHDYKGAYQNLGKAYRAAAGGAP